LQYLDKRAGKEREILMTLFTFIRRMFGLRPKGNNPATITERKPTYREVYDISISVTEVMLIIRTDPQFYHEMVKPSGRLQLTISTLGWTSAEIGAEVSTMLLERHPEINYLTLEDLQPRTSAEITLVFN
jgi:hypothetical protein